jgi:phosphoglycolate phosphatase
MNKPILLWDFDGVMADSTQFVFSYWRQEMKKAGIDFKLSDYQATFTHKFPFEYLSEHYPTVASHIKQRYSEHEENYYPQKVRAFPEFMSGFLATQANFEHHIISSNLKSVIEAWLKIQGLSPYFQTVVGREVEGYKDQKINDLLAALNRDKKDALFIGDTTSDVQHAQSAGLKNIAVSWGVHSHSQLEKAQPDIICDTMDALFKYLKNGI